MRLFEACSAANFIAPVCRHLLDVLRNLSALPGFCLSAELRVLANQVLDSIRADHIFEFNELLRLHAAEHFYETAEYFHSAGRVYDAAVLVTKFKLHPRFDVH